VYQNFVDVSFFVAHNRGDSTGTTGLGFSALMGLGSDMNVSRAVDFLQSAAARHNAEANFIMGEFLMGLRGSTRTGEASVNTAQLQKNRQSSVNNDGPKGVNRNRGKQTGASNQNTIDFAAAAAFYSAAVQRGHVLAMYRLAHMYMNGFGVVKSCTSAVNTFKAFAEKADWSRRMTVARRLYENLIPADNQTFSAFYSTELQESFPIKLEKKLMTDKKPVSSIMFFLLGKLIHMFLNIDVYSFFKIFTGDKNTASSSHSKSALFRLIARKRSSLENMNKKAALSLYAQLAAVGYENSQSNAAHIISKEFCPSWISSSSIINSTFLSMGPTGLPDTKRANNKDLPQLQLSLFNKSASILPDISSWRNFVSMNDTTCDARALLLYGLSALQVNSDSYLRVGDFFYYGKAGIKQVRNAVLFHHKLHFNQTLPFLLRIKKQPSSFINWLQVKGILTQFSI